VTVTTSNTTLVVSGLTASGDTWSFSVAALNSIGPGTPASTGELVSPTVSLQSGVVVLSSATTMSDDDDIFAWDDPVPKQVSSLTAGPYTTGWDSTS
jgi:hypothetical protein